MERIIGRKKIEEIRDSLRKESFKLYPQKMNDGKDSFIGEVPNFLVNIIHETKKSEKYIMNDEYIKDLLCENPLFLNFLTFINEYCPVSSFEMVRDSEKKDVFSARFGNSTISIYFRDYRITSMSVKSISEGGKPFETEIMSFHNLLKNERIKGDIEYCILDYALRMQYNII